MAELIREPIGLRVLIRALRPDDHEPFLLWRANPQIESDALIEAGQTEQQALLWASLLRWREAEVTSQALTNAGWSVTLHGVRAIALARAITVLQPPTADQGWTLTVDDLQLRAVPELPSRNDESLERLLAFLET
jgi:hypothetical protein